jgi:hypothetical protein
MTKQGGDTTELQTTYNQLLQEAKKLMKNCKNLNNLLCNIT